MGFEEKPATARRVAVLSVHVFTASGAVAALLALYAAIDRDFPTCFAWLGVALFIDGIDGTLARLARVAEAPGTIDGVILDLVVDFLTYVLVPIIAIWRSDLMPAKLSFWLGMPVIFASALYFSDTRMKTRDYWFRGFPALWNVLALYFFVLRPPAVIGAGLLILGSGAMFAPFVFVHPMRVAQLRWLTIAVSLAFFALATWAILRDFDVNLAVKAGFLVVAAYFLGLPFLRHSPWADT